MPSKIVLKKTKAKKISSMFIAKENKKRYTKRMMINLKDKVKTTSTTSTWKINHNHQNKLAKIQAKILIKWGQKVVE